MFILSIPIFTEIKRSSVDRFKPVSKFGGRKTRSKTSQTNFVLCILNEKYKKIIIDDINVLTENY